VPDADRSALKLTKACADVNAVLTQEMLVERI
jgi:hypothetical protein